MGNKGFTIQDELASVGAKLALPHFKGKKQFTKESEHNKKKKQAYGFMLNDIWRD